MECKNVRIGQIVTVSTDTETLYKVVKVTNTSVELMKISNDSQLIEVPCVELVLIANS